MCIFHNSLTFYKSYLDQVKCENATSFSTEDYRLNDKNMNSRRMPIANSPFGHQIRVIDCCVFLFTILIERYSDKEILIPSSKTHGVMGKRGK